MTAIAAASAGLVGILVLDPSPPARAADTPPATALAAPAAPAAPEVPVAPAVPAAPKPEPGPQVDPAALEPMAFLAGCWEGEQEGTRSEECWMAPSAGLMVGMHRDVFKNGRTTFEFLRIEALPTGVVYLASPRGAPATPFSLVRTGTGRVEFSNPMHDYPQRILYWADGHNRLKAVTEGPSKGKTLRKEWTWTRKK
jgi:hypothetical protein